MTLTGRQIRLGALNRVHLSVGIGRDRRVVGDGKGLLLRSKDYETR